MPIDASIPLQIRPPDAVGKLSEIVGLQRQQAALQGERQTVAQRRALADFDMSKIIGDDGTVDLNKIPGSGFREAAGDQYGEQLASLLGIKQQQIQAKQSLVNLKGEQRGAFSQMIGAIRSDPDIETPAGKEKIAQAIAQFGEMYGPDVADVVAAYAKPLMAAPDGKRGQVLQNVQLQATSADSQATRQTPNYPQVNTGTKLERIQTNAYAPGGADVPKTMELGIAPGQQSQQTSDQLGNLFVQRRDPKGNIIGYEPVKGGPASFGAGERQSFEHQAEQNFTNVSSTRMAAAKAPQQLDQIHKAKELSREVSTGEWAAKRGKIESGIASLIPGFTAAADDATKLQLLDKFAERIAADSAQVLGSNASTDAARDSIHRQNANIGYTKDAVKAVLEYAEAQTLAMNAKGDAQEKWLKQPGNGIVNAHEFETQWRQAYDPVLFQLDVATPEERKKIVQGLPKAEAASLKAKRDALRELGAIK